MKWLLLYYGIICVEKRKIVFVLVSQGQFCWDMYVCVEDGKINLNLYED